MNIDLRPVLRAVVLGFALGTVTGLATAPLGAQSPPSQSALAEISLEEAIRLAHEYNPAYRIQEAQGEVAPWRSREAWGSMLPTLSTSSSFGYTASGERRFQSVQLGSQPGILSSSYNLSLSMSVSGQALLRPRAVEAQNRATEANIEGASAGLVSDVTQAYLAILQADEELRQAEAEVERTRTYVRQAEAQVEVGAGTPLDIRRAEGQLGQAEVRLLQAENQVATTRLTLGRIMGTPIPVDARMTSEFEVFDPDLDQVELVARALEHNPVLRASQSQATAAGTQVRMARTQYFPSLSLSAGWSGSVFEPTNINPLIQERLIQLENQYNSCQEDNRIRALLGDPPRDCSQFDPSVPAVEATAREQVRRQNEGFPFDYNRQPLSMSLSISIPVFTGFSRQLQVEEARVAETSARQQVRAEELRLGSEVEAAVRAVRTARRTVELQARNRDIAAEELRLAQERFRLGLVSSIEVVDAQANLSEAERAQISAVYDFHVSFAALEALVGEPLRDR
jgi:outer membrane protein